MVASSQAVVEAARNGGRIAARALLADYPHLCTPEHLSADGILEDIAFDRGARIRDGHLSGADGRLVRTTLGAVIRIRNTGDDGRRRFTIAHELGHLVLGHGTEGTAALCADADAGVQRSSPDESAAHAFAAELLMPEGMVVGLIEHAAIDLALAHRVAASFNTSLVASARRVVELTDHPCAVVFWSGTRVVWARRSRTFDGVVEAGREVPEALASAKASHTVTRTVQLQEWTPTSRATARGVEHSVPVPSVGAVLTLIVAA